MKTKEFDFELPEFLIAKKPHSSRDGCNLLIVDRCNNSIEHRKFYNLVDYLNEGDILVFNDSKVIPARIFFDIKCKKAEILLVKKIKNNDWHVIGKPGKFLKLDKVFKINDQISFKIIEILPDGGRIVRFYLKGVTMKDAINKFGKAPFPPYIKNTSATLSDYQTIYAKKNGSIAAPTAGLHFTKNLLKKFKSKKIQMEFVTLHVGLGTFLPIKSENIEDHLMHKEIYSINKNTAERLNNAKMSGKRIVAVGTTSVRVLESNYDKKNGFTSGTKETDIYIYPGYKWKCVDSLVTNFHLPKSTLILLVCSFANKNLIFKAYNEAINKGYLFYSFGDAMLIL